MPTLLLTGARGLVGDAVLRYFHTVGWDVVAACSGRVRAAVDRLSVVPFDLAEVGGSALEQAAENADAVIHCAAVLPSSGLLATAAGARNIYLRNSLGTYDLIALAARCAVKQFVFISSANLYGGREFINEEMNLVPGDAYALSKVAGEAAVNLFSRSSSILACSLRIAAPYGARATTQAVIPTFVNRAMAGEDLELMGSGQREQVFTYVEDIARACRAAIDRGATGSYNIAGRQTVTMAELADAVVRATGGRSKVRFSGKPDPNEGAKRRISIERAERDMGWRPAYDLDRGLSQMVEEIRRPPGRLLLPAEG